MIWLLVAVFRHGLRALWVLALLVLAGVALVTTLVGQVVGAVFALSWAWLPWLAVGLVAVTSGVWLVWAFRRARERADEESRDDEGEVR